MDRTVVALFDDIQDARNAVEELVDNGFPRENISLVARDATGEYGDALETYDAGKTGEDTGEAALAGAGIGAVLGGFGGLLLSLGALAIPGIGPVLAAGPLVAALAGAGIGAAAGGLIGALTEVGVPEEQAHYYAEGVRRGGTLVTVQTTAGRADDAVEILNDHNPVDINRRVSTWRQNENWDRFDHTAEPYTTEQIDTERDRYARTDLDKDADVTIPVVEEEMRVGKREKETGGVRVHTFMTEEPVEETVELRKEDVDVERHRVDRPADEADIEAFEEKTFEIPTSEEEVVADKQAHVVEEVEIDKDVETEPRTIRDTVRRTDVEVEPIDYEGVEESDYEAYEPMWRNHFTSNYSTTGDYDYDYYRPAYTYGYMLATDNRYANRNWNDIEPTARSQWERTHQDSAWDDVKDAVRTAWEEVKGSVS
jgi:uncharacterized protein (TIGR02271 family)